MSIFGAFIIYGQILDTTPVSIKVVAGKNLVLPCHVEDIGTYKVIFSRNNEILYYGETSHVSDERLTMLNPYDSDWNLHIKGVKFSDQGVYHCRIMTTPQQIKTLNVTVEVSSKIIHTQSSNDLKVPEHENVTLVCVASGVPSPKFQWYFRKFTETKMGEHIVNGGSGTLLRRQITRDQAVPPEVNLLNPTQSQFLGRDTELHCEIAGEPLEETKWMRGNVKLPFESFKYRQALLPSRDHIKVLSLEIRGLDKSDFGEYSCFAYNKYGMAKKSMKLVEAKTTTTTSTSTTPSIVSTTLSSTILSTTTRSVLTSPLVVDRNASVSGNDPSYTVLPTKSPIDPESQGTDSGSRVFNVTTVYVMVALTCKLLTIL
ncbi:hypothetical protein KUTeg_018128 [Tegillarca granosa]|uniref:Ig-like domain-containing protein n=1 Tax=Tegillarca granosa TaxID=220873 RepID=A0ABQ9EMA4_TEGGR|nr:hypothetical protein KUTeg_018128 [Tegillarca granosa]